MRRYSQLVAGVVACLIAGVAHADEETVPLDKLPAAITAAVKKRFPSAEMVRASKETEDGKTVFEVAIKDKGQKSDVSLTADGKIIEIEKTMSEKDLPAAAAAALAKKYPGAKYRSVEEISHVKDGKESLDYFEVNLTGKDQKKWEVCVTAGGEIKKTEGKGTAK